MRCMASCDPDFFLLSPSAHWHSGVTTEEGRGRGERERMGEGAGGRSELLLIMEEVGEVVRKGREGVIVRTDQRDVMKASFETLKLLRTVQIGGAINRGTQRR